LKIKLLEPIELITNPLIDTLAHPGPKPWRWIAYLAAFFLSISLMEIVRMFDVLSKEGSYHGPLAAREKKK